jgi:putative chitinase
MDAETLRKATGCTAATAAAVAEPLSAACAFYGIDTPKRLAAFLAQIGHESGSFRFVREIWGPTDVQRRYEGREDLGNTQPGDGERFKGRGFIQITGRFNYAKTRDRLRKRFPDVPDFEQEPERLEELQWACLSACDYWDSRGLNALADADDFERITRKINGGLNGQADRLARWERAKTALASTDQPQEVHTMPLPAIAAAALPLIVESIPKLAKLFGSGSEVAERNIKAAETVIGIVTESVGARNVQEAIEAIQADPQAAQAASQAVEARWFELTEAGGGGIDGARKADAAFSESGRSPLHSPAFLISILLMVFPAMLLVDVFYVHPASYTSELRTQIVTAVLGVILTVGAFWLGSSFGSQRKDERAAK